MGETVHLGLDVGGTASRWVACSADGAVLARGAAPGATGHVFNPAERQRLAAMLAQVGAALAAEGLSATRLVAGLTGFGAAALEEVRALMAAQLALSPSGITVMDDIVLAYAASFGPGEGHLVSAGTGSIGLHVTGEGDIVRVGGRGILIDDGGSGSWIALRALDRMYRALDRDGSFDAVAGLARQVLAQVGGTSWSDVRQFVYGGDRGRIGTLAVAVAQAAEEGDAAARELLVSAGTELAALAEALIGRCGTRPVRVVGGVLRLHPLIAETIRSRLDGVDVAFAETDAALAAARLQGIGAWAGPLARGLGV